MEPPPGFIVSDDLGIKCHLRKAIYWLKQAGRAWQELVKKRLLSMGFKVSQADKCLYLKGNTFVLFYVDDGLMHAWILIQLVVLFISELKDIALSSK
jgi:hypothetical protein